MKLRDRILLLALAGAFCLMASAGCTNATIESAEFEEMLFLRHRGADMPVWVRGNPESDVVLLIVHGGAGASAGALVEDFDDEVEQRYKVAYWDQRHAGSSQGSARRRDFSVDNALELMALDMKLVIDMLRARYGEDQKIFAFGHSWGVQLGTKYLIDHGDRDLAGWIASNGAHASPSEYASRHIFVRTYAQAIKDAGDEWPQRISDREGGTIESAEDAIAWSEAHDPVTEVDEVVVLWDLAGSLQTWVLENFGEQEFDTLVPPSHLYLAGPYSRTAEWFNLGITTLRINNVTGAGSIQEFYDFTPDMGSITLPTALLWGAYDFIMGPEVAEDYARAVGTLEEDLTLKFYPVGHSPSVEASREFQLDVVDFIEAHR
ncbi:MAG: alpha/beta fold hydrolase [Myxococcota bacterium]